MKRPAAILISGPPATGQSTLAPAPAGLTRDARYLALDATQPTAALVRSVLDHLVSKAF